MKKILLFCLFATASFQIYAQTVHLDNETFTYNSNTVYHYGLGWYPDPDAVAYGPMAYLSGFGGIKFFSGGAFKGVMDVNGNLGLGTNTPAAKLDVNGSQRLNGDLSFANDQTAYFIHGYGNGGAIRIRSNIYAGIDRNVQFGNIDNNGSWSSFMIVDQTGNVGIGTITPDTKLAVNGTIHSKEVKIDLIGWPDYVFKPTYTLPKLKAVKKYIDQNHHLPEMPSEQEVAKNGLNLGEMNVLLTKKVEELTLYLIEKDKQLADYQKSTQSQINQLKKQLKALTKN